MNNGENINIFPNNRSAKRLDLSGRYLDSISHEIDQLQDLEELLLSNNMLTDLPPELGQLKRLLFLDLKENQFESIPEEIFKLRDLRELDLRYNILTNVPTAIGQLVNLNNLNLGGNKLTNITPEIKLLINLQVLYLSRNQITDIPAEIGSLINLVDLYLSHNKLTMVPKEIGQLQNLKKLYLSNNLFAELPEQICNLINLEELYMTENLLSAISREFGRLTNLNKLDLNQNKINAIPVEIAHLIKLKELNLRNNQLLEIPDGIGELSSLIELNLGNNQLSTMPPQIGQLAKLTTLDCSNNRLTNLPAEIGQMSNLTELDLCENQLTGLPAEIGRLDKLNKLYLRNNRITDLPATIGQLKNLKILDLRNNPLPIPPEFLEEPDNPLKIITYYRKHYQVAAEKKPLNEAKVLLLGQGAAGKTSLLKRLTENTFDPNEEKTEGIDIHRWQMTVDGGEIYLNLWDFGGQEIMHATHQFFLTRRSLYLLVLNSRQTEQENRVEYWLRLIKSFGGESPVIVICNHCDEHEMEMNWRGLSEKYENIKAIVRRVSCKSGEGIEELQRRIKEEVRVLPHIHNELLTSWFAVKNELAAMSEAMIDFIPYSGYQEICSAHHITEAEDQKTLLGFLHDLGIVLHFRDHPLLEDTNVLNPEWVTQGVYTIINHQLLTEKKGVLDLEDLGHILNPKTYPRNKQMFIINMMRKFEMCFDFIGFTDKKFLISVKLPLEPPELQSWPDCLRFQYRYEVLPESIITRFMVRMQGYIDGDTYWRHGVRLKSEDGENQALVRADLEDRKITIAVTGNQSGRRDLLRLIRADFYRIHKTFGDLNVQEKIPLSDKPEILVDYQHLLYLEKSGVENFIPEGCYFSVPVKILLDGIEPEEERRRKALPESKYAWPMGGFMRDQYIIGQAGSVGPGSQSQGMQFQQVWNEIQPHTDLEVLAQDLEKLKKRLQGEAETPDQLQAVTDVALAAQEAKVGNGPKILEYLKKGGVWVLKKAEDIGTKVAVEVIKKAMGL